MAALEGTPQRVKSLLTSFLQPSSSSQASSDPANASPKSLLSICQPRSKEAFWERVETFSPFTWFAKPLELSPLYCSLYGWENIDVDILRCSSCQACIDATMPSDWDPEIFAKSCENLKNSLVASHSKLCPWPDNPCPDTFVQLPMYTQDQWKKDFVVRWHSLLSLGLNLPLLDDLTYSDMDEVTDAHIDALQQLFHTAGKELALNKGIQNTKQVIRISSLIALCGWNNRNIRAEAEHCTLFCTMCRRELGLWNFKSHQSVDITEMSSKSKASRSTARGFTGDRGQQSSSQVLESMDTSQLSSSSSSSLTIEDDSENIRRFAGCKRPNKGQWNPPSRNLSSTSADIEECMDIEEKLKLKGHNESSALQIVKSHGSVEDAGNKGIGHGVSSAMQTEQPHSTASNLTEANLRNTGPVRESLLIKRLVSGRDSPLKGRLGTEGLPYRSPLHSSISDLSEKEHCESLCVEVEEESLTEKLQAVESELEFMAGQIATDKEDYAPDIKRIRLEDLEQTKFNPLSEHRSWCPWVTCVIPDKSQNPSESISGWRMLLRTVLPSFYPDKIQNFTNVPPREAWKPVKILLSDCSSIEKVRTVDMTQ